MLSGAGSHFVCTRLVRNARELASGRKKGKASRADGGTEWFTTLRGASGAEGKFGTLMRRRAAEAEARTREDGEEGEEKEEEEGRAGSRTDFRDLPDV